MNKYTFAPGAESKQVIIRAIDNATGLPDETLLYNTAGLALYYRREGGLNIQITPLAELLTIDAAYSSGGFIHIGNGYYRVDTPNAVQVAGSNSALIHGVGTDITITGAEIMLESIPNNTITALDANTYGSGSNFTQLMTFLEALKLGAVEVTGADGDTATIVLKDAAGNIIATFEQPTSGATKGSRTLSP